MTASMPRISRTDARLIAPHLDVWNDLISKIPPDKILSKAELMNMIAGDREEGAYRDQFVGALVRYSLARGDLSKLGGEFYIRIGLSRDSVVALSQYVSLAGLFVVEDSPGTFLGYEDLAWEDGRRERHYTMFARSVGESMKWLICSTPVVVELDENDQPKWDDRTRGFVAKRLEWTMLI